MDRETFLIKRRILVDQMDSRRTRASLPARPLASMGGEVLKQGAKLLFAAQKGSLLKMAITAAGIPLVRRLFSRGKN